MKRLAPLRQQRAPRRRRKNRGKSRRRVRTQTRELKKYIHRRGIYLHCLADCLCADTPKELTEEEKLQVLHSEDFLTFFERGSRIVERALAEQVDVCFDYSGRDLEDKEG